MILTINMGRCGKCKWWKRNDSEGMYPFLEHGVQVSACLHTKVIHPNYGDNENRIMKPDGILTADEGGCTGDLITGHDFGCIHFEP